MPAETAAAAPPPAAPPPPAVAPPPVADVKPPDVKPPEPKVEPVDAVATMTRREVDLQKSKEALKAEIAKVEADKAKVAKMLAAQEKLAAGDPDGALAELGTDYDKLTSARLEKLAPAKVTPKDVEATVDTKLQGFVAEQKKQAAEAQAAADAKAIAAHAKQAAAFVTSNAEKYPLVASFGEGQRIHKMILDDLTAKLAARPEGDDDVPPAMSFDEAAAKIEADLKAKVEAATGKKGVAAALAAPPAKAPATISGDMGGTTGAAKRTFANDDERMAAAMAVIDAAKKK